MLVRVASFPRSGSALTRSILWQCFGVHVSSTAEDARAAMSTFLGPRRFATGLTAGQLDAAARAADGPELVKTHALPADDAPAIVIVRDGRPVMTSYARFRTEVAGHPTSVASVIAGRPRDWSEHVNAWLDHECRKLVLRYEDLRVAKQSALDAISAFIGRPQIAPFTITVEEVRAIRPTHIPVAHNAPGIKEIERDHAEAFWSRHGATMARLGYER